MSNIENVLTLSFRSKGNDYSISLDSEHPDRNYDDENYAEWFVTAEDGRILDVTVWKDANGHFTRDAIVEVYDSRDDFEEGMLLDKKYLRISKRSARKE